MALAPVQFYLAPQNWPSPELLSAAPSENRLYFTNTEWNWILQTYLKLRQRGCVVELTKEMPDTGIVVLNSGRVAVDFRPSKRLFVVSVSADESPDVFAQMRITQNKIQTRLMADAYDVPHWPQPGLMGRDLARGSAFSSVGYFGDDQQLAPELRGQDWSEFLGRLGIDWHIRNARSARNTDFTDIDAMIAVRSFKRAGYIRKPASKLFNAWIAGVPAILGREFAFRELRRSALDYIEVSTIEEARTAVASLAAQPDLRRAMTENGLRRAAEFTTARIADRWQHLLFEVAQHKATRWFAQSAAARQRFFLRRVLEKKARGVAYRVLRALDREQYAI